MVENTDEMEIMGKTFKGFRTFFLALVVIGGFLTSVAMGNPNQTLGDLSFAALGYFFGKTTMAMTK